MKKGGNRVWGLVAWGGDFGGYYIGKKGHTLNAITKGGEGKRTGGG